MEIKGDSPLHATFAVQGLGAMGAAVLRYFSESGARLTALGDPRYGGTWAFSDRCPANCGRRWCDRTLRERPRS